MLGTSLLGITFQEACESFLLTQAILSPFSMILKSHMFSPPFFYFRWFPRPNEIEDNLPISWIKCSSTVNIEAE